MRFDEFARKTLTFDIVCDGPDAARASATYAFDRHGFEGKIAMTFYSFLVRGSPADYRKPCALDRPAPLAAADSDQSRR
jgi:hypothetical protein